MFNELEELFKHMQTGCLQSMPGAISVEAQGCMCTGPVKRPGPKREILSCNYESVMASGFERIVGMFSVLFNCAWDRGVGFVVWGHEILFPKIFIVKFSTGEYKNQ